MSTMPVKHREATSGVEGKLILTIDLYLYDRSMIDSIDAGAGNAIHVARTSVDASDFAVCVCYVYTIILSILITSNTFIAPPVSRDFSTHCALHTLLNNSISVN